MNPVFSISVDISTSDPTIPLGLEVWLDDLLVSNFEHVKESISINHDFSDQDAEHELRFILKNKTNEHTQVDKDGKILRDAVLNISNLKFDEIELNQIFYKNAVYIHNFNGNGPETKDSFHGSLGCNGTVTLKFTTPVYLWLLENM